MTADIIQLIDDTTVDDSIVETDFLKIFHQHGAQVDDKNENIKFCFRDNLNYIQIGNSYFEVEIVV